MVDDFVNRDLANYRSSFELTKEMINKGIELNQIQSIIWHNDFEQEAQKLLRAPVIRKQLEPLDLAPYDRDYAIRKLASLDDFEGILRKFFEKYSSLDKKKTAEKLCKFIDKKVKALANAPRANGVFENLSEAKSAVFEWIDVFYNRKRYIPDWDMSHLLTSRKNIWQELPKLCVRFSQGSIFSLDPNSSLEQG